MNKSAVQSVTGFKPLPNEQLISLKDKPTNQPNKSQGCEKEWKVSNCGLEQEI